MCASVHADSISAAPGRPSPLRVYRGQSVEVVAVADRRARHDFVHFPWRVQAGDPCWAPPLLIEAEAALDPRHPFLRHGGAQAFVAYHDGQPVGRIMASDDPRFCAAQGNNAGGFGMFECVDDTPTAHALLDAAADWLRQRGRTAIMGPWDFSTNYPCGLLVDGFDTPQRILMNHNPRYYARLLERWGLRKAKDLYAWFVHQRCPRMWRWFERAERLAQRGGITIRPIRFAEMQAEIDRCKRIYHSAWRGKWGFVPMTDVEFEHMVGRLRHLADPNLILLAEAQGEVVGMSITLPDWYEVTRPLNGRLTWWGLPIGLARLMWNRRRIRTARVAVLGVLEGFRRRGVAELMIARTLGYCHRQLGCTGAEMGWTLEDNEEVNRTIQGVGAERYKTYRVYQRSLAR